MHDTGQDEKAAGGASEGKHAREVTGYSVRSTTSTTGYAAKRWIDPPATDRVTIDLAAQPKRWSDDPWSELRPEQAWRAGWEAAKSQARECAEAKSEWHEQQAEVSFSVDAHKAWACHRGGHIASKQLAEIIAAMEPSENGGS